MRRKDVYETLRAWHALLLLYGKPENNTKKNVEATGTDWQSNVAPQHTRYYRTWRPTQAAGLDAGCIGTCGGMTQQ